MGWLNINGNWIGRHSGKSWSSYWTHQSEVLFFGLYSEISGGQMPNRVDGGATYLTVAGSAGSETYQCPNTSDYISADSDNLWFKWNFEQRTVTTAELIGYDFSNTPVKYGDAAPNGIEAIIILSTIPTGDQLDKLFRDMKLPIYWNGIPNVNGYLKSNRGLTRSIFTPDANLITTDGHSKAWWNPSAINGKTELGGADYIYWDKLITYGTLGDVLNSGTILPYGVYKIVTTEPNRFYIGCQPGDTFVALTGNALNGNNTVRRYEGNHLGQFTSAARPIGGIFDGIAHFMRCPTFLFTQPEFIYLVIKPLGWATSDYLFDGTPQNTGMAQQSGSTPRIKVYAGAASSESSDLVIGSIGIIRVLFNGLASKLIIDGHDPITGNFGSSNMGGFTIGGSGANNSSNFSNIKFYEGVLRDNADGESEIYAYLQNKIDLGLYTD